MRSIVVAALVGFALCSFPAHSAEEAQSSDIDTAVAGVVLPRSIGPLQFVGDRQFDDPRLGKAYSYRADGFSLDIYIYQGTSGAVPDGATGEGARSEYEAAKSTVLATDAYATRLLVSEAHTRLGEAREAPEALEASFDLVLRGTPLRSFLWVTVANGHYVKARFSMNGDLDLEAEPARAQVMEQLGAVVTSARERKPVDVARTPRDNQYQIQFENAVAEDEMPFWLLYLLARISWEQQQGASVTLGSDPRVPTFEEEVFARNTAVSAFNETLDAAERSRIATAFPYFGELKAVIDAGFLREYVWLELRKDTWTRDPDGLRADEYQTWRAQFLPNHVAVTRGVLRLSSASR
jgi:hypothetical protein